MRSKSKLDDDVTKCLKLMSELLNLPEGEVSDLLKNSIAHDLTQPASRYFDHTSGKVVSTEVLDIVTQIKDEYGFENLDSRSILKIVGLVAIKVHERYDDCSYSDIEDAARAWLITNVDEKSTKLVEYLEKISRLDGFRPDKWFERKLMLGPVFISPSHDLPSFFIDRFEEAKRCYIYGNTLAAIALNRATLEAAIQYKYKKDYNKIEREIKEKRGLKGHVSFRTVLIKLSEGKEELKKELYKDKTVRVLAEEIIDDGNKALHEIDPGKYEDLTVDVETTFIESLVKLERILEYLFKSSG